jgi:hypothetical protein
MCAAGRSTLYRSRRAILPDAVTNLVLAAGPKVAQTGTCRLKPAEFLDCLEERGTILGFPQDMRRSGVAADLPLQPLHRAFIELSARQNDDGSF